MKPGATSSRSESCELFRPEGRRLSTAVTPPIAINAP